MLKNIPPILSPELLKVLCEMGHGDKIVIADGNFPSQSVGKKGIVIRADGHKVTELLDAVLMVFPLDTYVKNPVSLMQKVEGDNAETPVWSEYEKILQKHDSRSGLINFYERFEFYEQAKKSYAVIASGDTALYANIILQKGII